MVKNWRTMKYPMTQEGQAVYQQIWTATYSAFFAAKVVQHLEAYHSELTSEELDAFAKKAESYAEEAAMRGWDA